MSYSSGRTKHVLQLKTLDGKMTELKMLNVILDAVLVVIIMLMIISLTVMVNNYAENDVPEHVQKQLLNGNGYWE